MLTVLTFQQTVFTKLKAIVDIERVSDNQLTTVVRYTAVRPGYNKKLS